MNELNEKRQSSDMLTLNLLPIEANIQKISNLQCEREGVEGSNATHSPLHGCPYCFAPLYHSCLLFFPVYCFLPAPMQCISLLFIKFLCTYFWIIYESAVFFGRVDVYSYVYVSVWLFVFLSIRLSVCVDPLSIHLSS